MVLTTKARLGDRLLEKGLITEAQLKVALNEQRRAYRPLGEILLSLGFVRSKDITALLAEDLEIRTLEASDVRPDPLILSALDHAFVHSTGAFPFALEGGELKVAMVDPGNPEKAALVRERFPYPLQMFAVAPEDLTKLLRRFLVDRAGDLERILANLGERAQVGGEDFPVEQVVQALLVDGVHRGATDIHVEPEELVTRLRYRIDGILCEGESLPRRATDAILSRIKILSGLDIAERRRPQDGHLRVELDKRKVDLRVSVMPCTDGENAVLRILDRSGGMLQLLQLGFTPERQRVLERICDRSHGLFLVTGPTGSGKTTTLYAMLSKVDAMRRNVVTIEDPVEYRLPLLRQSQVDPSVGYGFQVGLRALLRQDPDVVLVGEIRDAETADMAIKASMTGHLVFSTLHTNSAIGAIPRLTDLGVDPYLVEDSLIGVLAQRLVRNVCAHCAEPAILTAAEKAWLGLDTGSPRRGKGCSECRASGYAGRSAITEVFLPDDEVADVLRRGTSLPELRELAYKRGFTDMTEDGRRRVRQGNTTMEEVERVNRSHRLTEGERENV